MVLATTGLLLLILGGCKRTTVVSGHVTCEGQSVQKGNIAFNPADGNGPACGSPIVDGQYRVEVPPGQKIVQITVVTATRFNLKNPQEAGLAAQAIERGDKSGTYDRVDPTFDGAEGNRVKVEVKPGSQSMDFPLKRAGSTSQARDTNR
jgi:hypothetical protein